MKRITALCLVLALLLSMTTAFAWSCSSCGAENGGKFCTECGTKKPAENICAACGTNYGEKTPKFCSECGAKMEMAAAPTVSPVPTATPAPAAEEPSIIGVYEEDGIVSVLWHADGQNNYQIRYALKRSDDVQADLEAANGLGYFYHESKLGIYALRRLVPGESYWIGVFDEAGRGHYMPFTPQAEVEPFYGFANVMYGQLKLRAGGTDAKVEAFSLADLDNADQEPGMLLAMMYKNTGDEYKPSTQIVMEAPNGAKKVIAVTSVTFEALKDDIIGWGFVSLKEHFDLLKDRFGMVPVGDHKVSIYLDGQLLGTQIIPVTAEAAATAVPTAAPTAVPTAVPTAEPTIPPVAFADLVTNADGTLTVSWTGGVAPYEVRYAEKLTGDYHADLEAGNSFGVWTSTVDCQETSYVLNRLVPGKPYWIVVLGADGNGRYISYTPDSVGMCNDITASLEVEPRSRVGEESTELACIPAETAGLEGETEYGAYLYLNYDNPGEEREALFQLVFTLPNGAVRVDSIFTVTLQSGADKSLGWSFYDMDWYLGRVRSRFGELPQGDITVEIYLDGKLAASGKLPVKERKELVVTSAVQQADGRTLVTWEDNGNGPYTVRFLQRFSDDMAADQSDERGTGRWVDKRDLADTSWQISALMPGVSYWITVTDSLGEQGVIAYDAPVPGDANMGVVLVNNPRRMDGENITDLSMFSAAALNQEYTGNYGLYLQVNYNERSEETKLFTQWVLTLPNGKRFASDFFDMTWYVGDDCYWECFKLDWAFKTIKDWLGEVPQGEYRYDLYVEGDYAGSTTFMVGE